MPYRTLENLIDGVVITFNDATAARALEMALKDQASQLQQMADSLPALVFGSQPDGACDYLSRQWLEYTGVPEREQLGYGWIQQVHPEDRDRVRETWRAAVKAGVTFDSEFRIRRADGTFHWFKTRSVAIRDSAGAIVKWYGTNTDVDDLKREEVR